MKSIKTNHAALLGFCAIVGLGPIALAQSWSQGTMQTPQNPLAPGVSNTYNPNAVPGNSIYNSGQRNSLYNSSTNAPANSIYNTPNTNPALNQNLNGVNDQNLRGGSAPVQNDPRVNSGSTPTGDNPAGTGSGAATGLGSGSATGSGTGSGTGL